MIVKVQTWFEHVDRMVAKGDYIEVVYVRNLARDQEQYSTNNDMPANAAAWLAVKDYAQEAIHELRAEMDRQAKEQAA